MTGNVTAAPSSALAEQKQRAAGKLDQPQNDRIGMGIAVIKPGKPIAAELANRSQRNLRRKGELPAQELA
jgi:hypothetical protein